MKTPQPPAQVVSEFLKWSVPVRGKSNPEIQSNAVWNWLIETRIWPNAAHRATNAAEQRHPGWCFDRYGQTKTSLDDGREIYIGGEHEDGYAPDFYIYNDVVVQHPHGDIEIFGYPPDVFAPTDNHSATLWGDEVIIIGGLRYQALREPETTWIFRLNLLDFSITRVETFGTAPNWLHRHVAVWDASKGRIICSGGNVKHLESGVWLENLTQWEFDPRTRHWHEGPSALFERWILMREDESANDLSRIDLLAMAMRSGRLSAFDKELRLHFEQRGHSVDLELFATRFDLPIPHRRVELDLNGRRIGTDIFAIEGGELRIEEDDSYIVFTVEPGLPAKDIERLKQHGLATYSAIDGVVYKLVEL